VSQRGIEIPGVGRVAIPAPQAPSPDAQAIAGAIAQLIHLTDIALQVTLRLSLGWKVEDVIADMKLTVPPPPIPQDQIPERLLNRQERRARERKAAQ